MTEDKFALIFNLCGVSITFVWLVCLIRTEFKAKWITTLFAGAVFSLASSLFWSGLGLILYSVFVKPLGG